MSGGTRPAALLLALTLLASACGSTVRQDPSAPGAGVGGATAVAGGDGLSLPGTGEAPGGAGGAGLATGAGTTAGGSAGSSSGAAAGGAGAAVAGGTGGTGSSGTPTGGSGGGGAGGAGGAGAGQPGGGGAAGGHATAGQTARGVTAETITIGVYGVSGFDGFTEGMGLGVAIGNNQNQAQATIDWVNANGGVAGRQLQMAYVDADIGLAASSPDAEQQRACTAFTEDAEVFVMATGISTGDTFHRCMAGRGIPVFSGGDVKAESFFAEQADFFYMPGEMNFTRVMRHYADGLVRQGFFETIPTSADPLTTEPVIGLIYGEEPNEEEAVAQGLEPALAAHGLTIAERAAIPVRLDNQSAYSSAVLRFRAQGVTHVLYAFASPLLFMQSAEGQGYRPLHGLHSRSSPAAVLQATAPPAQLAGSMGVGWQPMNDVDASRDPGVLNDKQARCLSIMEEAGEDMSVRATALVALWFCDTILMAVEAAEAATELSPAGLRAGVETFGTGFQSATTFGTRFEPGRTHDGATQLRTFAFDPSCSCFAYTSDPYPVS